MERLLNIPVQMIASCNTKGDFTPLRFRFENKDCVLITVDVGSVLSRNPGSPDNRREILYRCRAPFAGRLHTFDLRYVIQDHKWFLYKLYS